MRLPFHNSGITFLFALIACTLLVTGCSSAPVVDSPGGERHKEASEIAASMVGKPYRYGGGTTQGFDCSGLVHYSFKHAGMEVPRSTETQRKRSYRVSRTSLSRGDLVFFDQLGKRSSHVGIYIGNNRFVHAPSSGKHVRVDSLADSYWQKHLVDTRRF